MELRIGVLNIFRCSVPSSIMETPRTEIKLGIKLSGSVRTALVDNDCLRNIINLYSHSS